jgi:erythrocyte band 7 integral membrane protein
MSSFQAHDSSTLNTVAESFTSSTRPIINNKFILDQHTPATANMSDINGKAPVNGADAARLDEPIIKVQPPRREDLQPSYAQIIKPDDADADTNGWYGSMVRVQAHPCPSYISNSHID